MAGSGERPDLGPGGEPIEEATPEQTGPVAAIVERKRSLLPPGITRVMGDFDVGDLVRIVGPDGREIARGLASYPARDMRLLCGVPSRDIERILGYRYDDEAVHREDLVLLR